MSVEQADTQQQQQQKQDVYDAIGRTLWDTGVMFIEDDKQDIGYTTYSGRLGHRYHGEIRPEHPSPFHHYQAGIVCCAVGRLFGFMSTLNQFQQAMQAAQVEEQEQEQQKISFRTGGLIKVPVQ